MQTSAIPSLTTILPPSNTPLPSTKATNASPTTLPPTTTTVSVAVLLPTLLPMVQMTLLAMNRNDVWADGTKKTTLDYAGQVTSSVSTSITYTTIAATTTLAIASSVGVVSTSASAAAAGVSAAGSAGTAAATLDIAQFAVCTGALSLPGIDTSTMRRQPYLAILGASNTLRLISTQMSFSTFTWFSFGNDDKEVHPLSFWTTRTLVADYHGPRDSERGGMFEYTSRLGIKPTMLMYVTLAGVGSVLGGIGVILVLVLVVASSFVKDKKAFQSDCCDRAVLLLLCLCRSQTVFFLRLECSS